MVGFIFLLRKSVLAEEPTKEEPVIEAIAKKEDVDLEQKAEATEVLK